MVALIVHSTKIVVNYLTSQFYEPNYNIQQRIQILDSLADAARELSKIKVIIIINFIIYFLEN